MLSAIPELIAASRRAGVELVVIPARDRMGRSLVTAVAAMRASRNSPPIYVYSGRDEAEIRELMLLARAGCRGLILDGSNDNPASLRQLVDEDSLVCVVDGVRYAAEQVVPVRYLPLVHFCLEHVTESPSAATVARHLNVSRRTLSSWAAHSGARGIRSLLSICRVLVALELLRHPRRSIEQVALELRFGSSANLHNMITRYTGLRPREAAVIDTATWCHRFFAHRRAIAAPEHPVRLPPRETALRRTEWPGRPNDAILPPTDQAHA